MAVKVQVPKQAGLVRWALHPWGKAILALFVVFITAGLLLFTYFYTKYARLIETKLSAGPFANTSMLFAAPHSVVLGEPATAQELAAELRRAGYTDSPKNRMGYYALRNDAIDIYPGPSSYFRREPGVVKLAGGKVSQIISLDDNTARNEYDLEPELISNLFDKNREKRRIVRFNEIPPVLVHAVVSVEDKRFFQHSGFDPLRIVKAVYVDLRQRRKDQGASTLSQQVARMFWLDQKKTWSRKFAELLITLHLEQKLTKQEIFEYYSNQVDLGRRGSFSIRGFAEAVQVYFGKDLSHISIPEAATLAGLIQRPSYTNPIRWPERARARRNVVLTLMHENRYISDSEYEEAVASPLALAKHDMESTDAPYFVDLVNDALLDRFQDHDFQSNAYRVYTTLDMQLQRDASEAVRVGMEEVDKTLQRRRKKSKEVLPGPQCALIALDPLTGEIKALVGGRDYGASQLNHALSKRQPGSSFKPFVYAAALNTALTGGNGNGAVLTPATTLVDEPTTFYYDGRPYSPSNFKHELHGVVTLRQAIAKSMNIPTVKVAEMVGYGSVVDLARRSGLNINIRPTPAVALGAYEVTPLEIAGAYTIFANHGQFVKPAFISTIRDHRGSEIFDNKPERRQVLDARIAYMMDSLLEEVLRSGTGAGVRAKGITFPAAGKTGTSHDGWFAGFTSKLICIVWVGYDDNRELNMEGAHSALPIWAEFMRRAHAHRQYRNVTEFDSPSGVVSVQIDPLSGELATPSCPTVRNEVFIDGTQPVQACHLHGGGITQIAGWEPVSPAGQTGSQNATMPAGGTAPASARPGQAYPVPVQPRADGRAGDQRAEQAPLPDANSQPQPRQPERKKGLFGRIRDIFR